MPLDALCLAAVREELSDQLIGLKIDKVQQPERDVLVLSLRGRERTHRLLISAGMSDMRVHLTEQRYENPASPPMFCMLLRKHLTGARILSVRQPSAERLLEFLLDAPDAMGEATEKLLVVELIAKSSNIVLIDADGIVIDCMKRVGSVLSDRRTVLPGLYYRHPTAQGEKTDPLTMSNDKWLQLLDFMGSDGLVDKWLLSTFSAFSPLICREIAWRAYGTCDFRLAEITDGGEALRREFFAIMSLVKSGGFQPWSILDADNSPRDFSYTKIMQYEGALELKRSESFSAMLDSHYARTAQLERLRQRSSATVRTVKTARDRILRKLAAQKTELEKTSMRESIRECGDIITANLHLMKKGQRELIAEDFFTPDNSLRDIPLDPLKTPQQNAAKYYKDYTKARNAESFLTEQIRLGEAEADYLDSVLEAIALAEGDKDMDEIRRELVQTGYVKEKRQKGGKSKPPPAAAPMKFRSSAGMEILAGRNNVQNDNLTLKSASKADVWLHTQKIHGSHVIICCNGLEPDDQTLAEAASIAAYYSSGRANGKVSVDFTKVRNVKKIPGGRPGMVTYTGYKTIVAAPDEVLVERLKLKS